MKNAVAVALLAAAAAARPTVDVSGVDFSKIDYTDLDLSGVDFDKIEYPPGTGENLPFYPTPPGGYPFPGKDCPPAGPIPYTSTFHVVAVPDQVRNGTTNPVATGGLPGATGYYDFGFNSDLNLVCYFIRLVNFEDTYQSPAVTATHIHQAARGANGPPRIAFPNPQGAAGQDKISVGCIQGPFRTGVTDAATGGDSGANFQVSQIEANPAGFFADVHSSRAVPGAVRGQLA